MRIKEKDIFTEWLMTQLSSRGKKTYKILQAAAGAFFYSKQHNITQIKYLVTVVYVLVGMRSSRNQLHIHS